MRAAQKNECPNFQPMTPENAQNFRCVRMPRRLFSDSPYADMSLDAKTAYAFLLDRLPLSIRNGWVNEQGEAFVVFPRSALSKTLGISEKRVSAAFRQLAEKELLREERSGFGKPNRIYLAETDVARMSGAWSGGGTADANGKGGNGACC